MSWNSNVSRPISRVLCSIETEWRPFICDICRHMPVATYPGTDADRVRCNAACPPIWSCSRWGLPCHRRWPARCALTAPFHPYRYPRTGGDVASGSVYRRFVFCGTFRGFTPPRRYLAPCPVEPGLSSATHAVNVTAAAAQPTHGGSVGFAAGRFNPRDPHD